MSYRSFTLRKKQRSTEKVTKFDTCSIYSTLSKKPADLETTDIDLSAIRIFLGDGSHRTLSSTPSTTCGEILDKLLEKLGLLEQRNNYGLQIHYQFAEPRVPDDFEPISQLNPHVWDSVDKIYLYKKLSTFVMMPLRKRVASYTHQASPNSDDQAENIYENCAVSLGYRKSNYDKSQLDPVLVNDKLASQFARAWTVATDTSTQQSKDVIPIETPPQLTSVGANEDLVSSPKPFNTYTLDRRQKRMNTLRRQAPISPSSKPEVLSPPLRRSSHTSSLGVSSPPLHLVSSQKSADKSEPSHFQLSVCSTSTPSKVSVSSQGSLCMSPDIKISEHELELDSSTDLAGSLILNPLHKKSMSEGCLLSAYNSESLESKSSSTRVLRDSGFHDETPGASQSNLSKLPPQAVRRRRTSASLEDIPKSVKAARVPVYNHSQSVPLLALHAVKAHSKSRSMDESDDVFIGTNVNASSLKSYKSMELLSGDDLDEIEENLSYEHSVITPQFPGSRSSAVPPPVPKRDSSCLDNCSVSDDYLLKQGKRLSHVLNINATIKSEERGHIRTFFDKVGTMLTRKKRSPSSLSMVSTLSPTSPRPTMASPVMTPPSASQPVDIPCSFPNHSSSSSPTLRALRMKKLYSQSSGISGSSTEQYDAAVAKLAANQTGAQTDRPLPKKPEIQAGGHTRSLDRPLLKKPGVQADEHTRSLDRPLPKKPGIQTDGHTRSLDRPLPKKSEWRRPYDVAVPSPIPTKKPIPDYLQIISPSQSMSSIYENFEMNDTESNSFYQTPPSQPRYENEYEDDDYENHFIQGGLNGSITLDGNMLHDYQVPPPQSAVHKNSKTNYQDDTYENCQIKNGVKGAITFDGRDLHDYQTPPCSRGAENTSSCYSNKNQHTSPPPIPPHIPINKMPKGPIVPERLNKSPDDPMKTYPPCKGSNTGSYSELIADWIPKEKPWKSSSDLFSSSRTEGASQSKLVHNKSMANMHTTDTTDDSEIYYDDQTQSEPDVLNDQNEDEYMIMQPQLSTEVLCQETQHTSKTSTKGRVGPPVPIKSVKGNHSNNQQLSNSDEISTLRGRVEALKAQFSQENSAQQTSKSLSTANRSQAAEQSSHGPSSTLGPPPAFVPTAPKPKSHMPKYSQGSTCASSVPTKPFVKKSDDSPPLPPPTNTIPSSGQKSQAIPPPFPLIPRADSFDRSAGSIQSPPPHTLQLRKESPKKQKQPSPFTTASYLPPPSEFNGSPTPVSSPPNKKPMFPPSPASTPLTRILSPVFTPSTPPLSLSSTHFDGTAPSGTLLIPPPPNLPPTPPPNARPLPSTPKKQISPGSPKTFSMPHSFSAGKNAVPPPGLPPPPTKPLPSPPLATPSAGPHLPPTKPLPSPPLAVNVTPIPTGPPPPTKPLPSLPLAANATPSTSTGPPPPPTKPLPLPPLAVNVTPIPTAPPPPTKPLPSLPLAANATPSTSTGPPPPLTKPLPPPPLATSVTPSPTGPPLPLTKPLPSPPLATSVAPLPPPLPPAKPLSSPLLATNVIPPPPIWPPPPPSKPLPSLPSVNSTLPPPCQEFVPPPPPLKTVTSKQTIQPSKESSLSKNKSSTSTGDFTAELFAMLKSRAHVE